MRQGDHYNASDTRSNSPNYGTSYQEIGHDLMIRCIVYTGMTESEESLLFAQQTGESAQLTPGDEMRAKIYGGDPECMRLLNQLACVWITHSSAGNTGSAVVVVLQNETGNKHSPTLILLCCKNALMSSPSNIYAKS